jgi:hypothetical protein
MSKETFDTRPFLILCEGVSDKHFFDRLIAKRQIENCFQVKFPHRGDDKTGGRSKFGAWLDVVADSEDFLTNIRAVLVVSDNDDASSFTEVKKSLEKAEKFSIPANVREVAQSTDLPALVILMVPIDSFGNLESLCLSAAYKKWPIKHSVDNFTNATDAKNLKSGKLSKMQLQCVIAATCAERPDAGFVGHWRTAEKFHIPLDESLFDEIVNFLKGFKAMVEAATSSSPPAVAARSA